MLSIIFKSLVSWTGIFSKKFRALDIIPSLSFPCCIPCLLMPLLISISRENIAISPCLRCGRHIVAKHMSGLYSCRNVKFRIQRWLKRTSLDFLISQSFSIEMMTVQIRWSELGDVILFTFRCWTLATESSIFNTCYNLTLNKVEKVGMYSPYIYDNFPEYELPGGFLLATAYVFDQWNITSICTRVCPRSSPVFQYWFCISHLSFIFDTQSWFYGDSELPNPLRNNEAVTVESIEIRTKICRSCLND